LHIQFKKNAFAYLHHIRPREGLSTGGAVADADLVEDEGEIIAAIVGGLGTEHGEDANDIEAQWVMRIGTTSTWQHWLRKLKEGAARTLPIFHKSPDGLSVSSKAV
jgi:hypothetical protein